MRSYFIPSVTLYLLSFVLEGPIRHVLNNMGLPYLLYLRDAIPFVIIVYILLFKRFSRLFIFTVWLFLVFIFIGILTLGNLYQVGFGVKLFTPFVLGIVCYHSFIGNLPEMKKIILYLLLISIGGVILNLAIIYPWEGISYTIGDIEIEGTRAWINPGELLLKRMAGLSRSSSDAAIQIIIFTLFTVAFTKNRGSKIVIWLLSGTAIMITTSKGVAFAFVSITVFFFVRLIIRRKVNMLFLIPSVIVMIGIPIYAISRGSNDTTINNPYIRFLFHSLFDRMNRAWPEAFHLIVENGSLLYGRGIGGIGAAQKFFEETLYKPGDNLFVYLYGVFGLFSIFIVLYTVIKARYLNISSSNIDSFIFLMLLYIIIHGFTASIIEPILVNFFAGLMMHHIYNAKPKRLTQTIRSLKNNLSFV